MSDARPSRARPAALLPWAVAAGAVAALVVRFAMDPLAISLAGATFAAPIIYAFMAKAATGGEVGGGVGLAIHWAVFVLLLPALWSALAAGRGTAARIGLAVAVPLAVWVLLMGVLMPLMGLPFFYNFSLTTIWSGVAFALLGAALVIVAVIRIP